MPNAVVSGIEAVFKSTGVKNPAKTTKLVVSGALLIGGALLIFGAVRIIKRRNDRLGLRQDKKDTRAEIRTESTYDVFDIQDEMSQVKYNANNLTITNGDAILIAQNLLAAMNRFGTNQSAIYENLEMCKTTDDLLLVINKFGIKNYDGVKLANPFIDKLDIFGANKMKNLTAWLKAELGASGKKKVEAIYNKLNVPF